MIPFEIILEIATNHLDTSDIPMLSMCTSELHNQKGYIINKIVSNDIFLNRYLSNRNFNILSLIENSSFTESQFFSLYNNIKNASLDIDEVIRPNKNKDSSFHCLQTTIDSTFEIFKLLKNYTLYVLYFKFRDIISTSVIEYFKSIYSTKFPRQKDYCNDIFNNFIADKDKNLWQTSNINLYNLYEVINLMHVNKRSYILKQCIESKEHGNVVNVAHNNFETIRLMISLFNYTEYTECKIHILYCIFIYTKTILQNIKIPDMEMCSYIRTVLGKITEFEKDLEYEHRSHIPRYLRTIMLEDTNELKQLIMELPEQENE